MVVRGTGIGAVLGVLAAAFATASATAGGPSGKEHAPEAPATVAQLTWLAGDWSGVFEGGCADERWTGPVANTLMGMYRYSRDGKVEFYEFQAIEQGPDGPTLLLRHFKPGLVAWEDKEKPLAFHLVAQGPMEAVFDHNLGKPARLTYKRTGADTLVVTVEHERSGMRVVDEFSYHRTKGLAPCEAR